MTNWRCIAMVIASLSLAASPADAQTLHTASRPYLQQKNPRNLDAVQLLEQQTSISERRVRFEWDNVAGATEYVLSGKWTSPPSWTVHASEFRVTRKLAKEWDDEKVLFDVVLPAGTHSWQVVAVFQSITSGDFGHPTLKAFEIK